MNLLAVLLQFYYSFVALRNMYVEFVLTLIVFLLGYIGFYFRPLWKFLFFINKKMDKFADELLSVDNNVNVNNSSDFDLKKNRIKQFLRTGNTRKAFGKNLLEKDVDGLNKEDVDKYYTLCETYLAKEMSDSLGKTIIGFYAEIVGGKIIGLKEVDGLRCDLEKDPFTNAALRKFTCNLYFSFGEYLAPFTVGAITMKHYLNNGENVAVDYCERKDVEEKIVDIEKNECK